GGGEPAGVAEHRVGQHCLQFAENGGGQRHCHWSHPAGMFKAGAYTDAVSHRAPYRQHDGDVRSRRSGGSFLSGAASSARAAASAHAGFRGRVTSNTVPRPVSDSTLTLPSWASTNSLTM